MAFQPLFPYYAQNYAHPARRPLVPLQPEPSRPGDAHSVSWLRNHCDRPNRRACTDPYGRTRYRQSDIDRWLATVPAGGDELNRADYFIDEDTKNHLVRAVGFLREQHRSKKLPVVPSQYGKTPPDRYIFQWDEGPVPGHTQRIAPFSTPWLSHYPRRR